MSLLFNGSVAWNTDWGEVAFAVTLGLLVLAVGAPLFAIVFVEPPVAKAFDLAVALFNILFQSTSLLQFSKG